MELLSKPQMNDFTVLVKTEQNKDTLAAIAPFTKEYPVLADKTSCYLCRGGACQAPVFDAESLEHSYRRRINPAAWSGVM